MSQFKIDIIKKSIEAREQEIALYEINIFNYETAVAGIDAADESMADFRTNLVHLIGTENAEKTKSEIILAALRKQLETLESSK